MSFPKKQEIEIPILEELESMGSEARSTEIYRRVAQHFPQLSQADLELKLKSGDKKWHNLVRWARLKLVETGEVVSGVRGVWRITDKGRKRLAKQS